TTLPIMQNTFRQACRKDTINLDGVNGLDTYLRVYDSAGTLIASNDDFDVTTSLTAWAADPTRNHGWALLPTGSNGVDFYSTDNVSYWVPRISVDYLAPNGDLHADTPDASATTLDLSSGSAGVSGTFEAAGGTLSPPMASSKLPNEIPAIEDRSQDAFTVRACVRRCSAQIMLRAPTDVVLGRDCLSFSLNSSC
ncbi:MAG: hypothetical protein ACKVII_18475, partial [Planctomycetales bacterium]